MQSGKPMTTPLAETARLRHCLGDGRGARTTARKPAARRPATTARPNATNHGSRSRTANRVAGSENENTSTPTKPSSTPGARTLRALVGLPAQ